MAPAAPGGLKKNPTAGGGGRRISLVAIVCVHGPLRQLAGGNAEHPVAGQTVCALLRALEHEHPRLSGWVLDERGLIRRHIHVYVNGDLGTGETTVAEGDRVEVLPAISGG
jgi:molybdopterin converting factor small subunit